MAPPHYAQVETALSILCRRGEKPQRIRSDLSYRPIFLTKSRAAIRFASRDQISVEIVLGNPCWAIRAGGKGVQPAGLDKVSPIVCNFCYDRNYIYKRQCAGCVAAIRPGVGKLRRAMGRKPFSESNPCAAVRIEATACGGRYRGCTWNSAFQCLEFPA